MLRWMCKVALCLVVAGCSYSSSRFSSGLVDRLKNRGPVSLSPDNPFLAANLLLAQESERSLELQGFLRKRGAPAALEIRKEFWSPIELVLYYPKAEERYVLEDTGANWVIRGPEYLSAEMAGELEQRRKGDRNVIVLGEEPVRANSFEMRNDPPLLEDLDPDPSTARPRRSRETRPRERSSTVATPKREPTKQSAKEVDPPLVDEEVDGVEITPKGDLVHYVTFDGEDLSAVARWYTDDVANAGKIARINRLNGSDKLTVGDSIVIPSYLLRRKTRMTESALRALQVLRREEKKVRE